MDPLHPYIDLALQKARDYLQEDNLSRCLETLQNLLKYCRAQNLVLPEQLETMVSICATRIEKQALQP